MARIVTIEDDGAQKAVLNIKPAGIQALARDTALAVGDGTYYLPPIARALDGFKLSLTEISVAIASTSGVVSFALYNVTQSKEMLSTNMTIDANETHSKDATTPAVINATNATVNHGDVIRVDCDGAGTGAKGLYWMPEFSS